jgi:hypothetical protein
MTPTGKPPEWQARVHELVCLPGFGSPRMGGKQKSTERQGIVGSAGSNPHESQGSGIHRREKYQRARWGEDEIRVSWGEESGPLSS